MKICIIGEFPPPMGGMAIQAQLLFNNLIKEGLAVYSIKRNICFKGLAKTKFVRGILQFIVFEINLIKMVFEADIFYIFSNSYLNYYLYTIPPLLTGRLFGKRVVVNYHGGAAQNFFTKKIHIIARWSLGLADKIIVPSGYLKDLFGEIGYKTEIIPNIIDLDGFKFKVRRNLSPKFIVTRHLEPVYNIEMMIRAFEIIIKKYPDASLKICGDGSERLRLENLTKSLKLEQSIQFLGEVENINLPDVYNEADIFINGSNIDNLPVAILEAFACGLPVVSTDAGGIKYIVKHGVNGLLVGLNDFRAMADNIDRLLKDKTMAEEMAKQAWETLKEYNWVNIKPQVLEVLKMDNR